MQYERLFHCFHGTTIKAYQEISRTKKFTSNPRYDHWLGNGIYFFLDDEEKAVWWAKGIAERKDSPACLLYIQAKIGNNKVLDLNTERGQRNFHEFLDILHENGIVIPVPEGLKTNEEKRHFFRCQVLDLLAEFGDYQASCCLFPNSSKTYMFKGLEPYGIMNNKGNQLCVYDQEVLDFNSFQKLEWGN